MANKIIKYIGNIVYPKGSIYSSTKAVSPEDIYGGRWEEISGKMLMGNSSLYTEDMGHFDAWVPNHTHTLTHTHTTSAHSHSHSISTNDDSVTSGSNVYRSRSDSVSGVSYYYTSNSVAHSHTVGTTSANTSIVGVSATDGNLPPCIVVKMWKRIALA